MSTAQDVIFEVTEENLETGMRGYPVGYCPTSSVDPYKGLFYVGQPVDELASREPEEVIFLLLNGREGSEQEIKGFTEEIRSRSSCSPQLIKQIENLPQEGHPMKLLCAALLLCGMMEKGDSYHQDCLNLIAKLPHLVAVLINTHAGWGETPPSRPELGYMENFAQMVRAPGANTEELTQAFKLFNVLHYDHGGGNLSTFVGKAVASGLEDMYGSISAAMAALAGPRHGKANQDCLEFVKAVLDEVGENASADDVERLVRGRLERRELVFGFGHAVLRVEDPRASVQYEYTSAKYADHPLVKIALHLREVGPKVLKENPKISNPYPNVDAISGTMLTAAGFPYPEYYTVLFGLSRCVGIAIQVVYEREQARNGKGLPIIRPKYFYRAREAAQPQAVAQS